MPRVYFLIRSLERGGAERQLIELVRGLVEDSGFEVTVGTLYDGGAMRPTLAGMPGVTLHSFGKTGRWDLRFLWRLARSIHAAQPDVIHGYMSPANELAVIAARLFSSRSVCGLRASNLDFARYDRLTRVLFRVGASISRFANATVVNSKCGLDHHVRHGHDASRMVVISNGIDCEDFHQDVAARELVRAEWQVGPDERLIGLVGRIDPMKDHATFLRAAASLKRHDSLRFVCVGAGSESLKASLVQMARELGVHRRLIWAGARDDMRSVYSALDILVSSSAFGEGFPNVVAEAMAVERPCIVTAVGDAATVVGDTGSVVPPRDCQALADCIRRFAALPNPELAALGAAARQRILTHFSRRRLADSTGALLRAVCDAGKVAR